MILNFSFQITAQETSPFLFILFFSSHTQAGHTPQACPAKPLFVREFFLSDIDLDYIDEHYDKDKFIWHTYRRLIGVFSPPLFNKLYVSNMLDYLISMNMGISKNIRFVEIDISFDERIDEMPPKLDYKVTIKW